MPIAPFGWQDAPSHATPVDATNLEAMHAAGGAYADGLVNPNQLKIVTLVYSASITPNAAAGPWQTVTVTNSTIFTINAPTSPPSSIVTGELVIEVLNSSGGAMGAITWDVAFVFAGLTWTNPANTKKRFARFEWNGTKWVATSLATADY